MAQNFPLIVSYYTKDTLYQLEVQNLISSCEKWGLEHHIEPIPTFGSWERNCSYKPFFLMEKTQQLKRPLLWVDADGVFLQQPAYLEAFDTDFAVRTNRQWKDDHPSKVISGTVFVNSTPGAERVLKSWAKESLDALADPNRKIEFWDQIALRDVVLRGVPGAVISDLPTSYMAIIDNPEDQKGEMVIGHYQASRRFKKIINS